MLLKVEQSDQNHNRRKIAPLTGSAKFYILNASSKKKLRNHLSMGLDYIRFALLIENSLT